MATDMDQAPAMGSGKRALTEYAVFLHDDDDEPNHPDAWERFGEVFLGRTPEQVLEAIEHTVAERVLVVPISSLHEFRRATTFKRVRRS